MTGFLPVRPSIFYALLLDKRGEMCALESSHALAYALKMARAEPEKEQKLVVNLSGRGDKDIFQVAARLEADGCLKDGRLSSDALGAYAD